jgi:hypothetical protein
MQPRPRSEVPEEHTSQCQVYGELESFALDHFGTRTWAGGRQSTRNGMDTVQSTSKD